MESDKKIFSAFERIVARIVRRAFNVQELEALRVEIGRMVEGVRKIAEKRALEICKKLNDAVLYGFTKVGEDMDKLEKRMDRIEARFENDGK